jgi:uncharacterized membrane protein
MKTFQKAIAGFLLCIGFAAIGLSALDLFNSEKNAREKQRASATLIVLGCVPVAVGGYILWAIVDNAYRQEQGRLRAAFFELVQAGRGKIVAQEFADTTELALEDATVYLDDRAESARATRQADDEGNVVYLFQLGYADPKRLLDAVEGDATHTYSLLLKTVPDEHEENILTVLQELMKVEPDAIKAVWKEPLLPIQIGMTLTIAQEYRKRLEEAGATVLVVLE